MYLLDKINEYSMLHPEFRPMFYDVIRTITIQVIAQLLFSINKILVEAKQYRLFYLS